jgi:hypothetical protein
MSVDDILVDYDVVNEISGHQPNKGVKLVEAAKNIFKECKEKAKQLAFNSKFIEFTNVDELCDKLKLAVEKGYSIRVLDENIGG